MWTCFLSSIFCQPVLKQLHSCDGIEQEGKQVSDCISQLVEKKNAAITIDPVPIDLTCCLASRKYLWNCLTFQWSPNGMEENSNPVLAPWSLWVTIYRQRTFCTITNLSYCIHPINGQRHIQIDWRSLLSLSLKHPPYMSSNVLDQFDIICHVPVKSVNNNNNNTSKLHIKALVIVMVPSLNRLFLFSISCLHGAASTKIKWRILGCAGSSAVLDAAQSWWWKV